MPIAWVVVVGIRVLSVLVYETVFVAGTVCACILGPGVYDCWQFCGVYDAWVADGSEASYGSFLRDAVCVLCFVDRLS